MVTFAQAQERAEEWINGEVPPPDHREVRVREFDLGFVVWAEDREGGPRSDGGGQRLVIARDSGEATLWPALPVGEVIRRYEEEYGVSDAPEPAVAPAAPARMDLNQTSFLLSPPEWLQEAADKLGIPDRRSSSSAPEPAAAPEPEPAATSAGPVPAAPVPAAPEGGGTSWPAAGGSAGASVGVSGSASAVPSSETPWAGTDTNIGGDDDDVAVPLPATVFSPPVNLDGDEEDVPPPSVSPEAKTALMSGGSQLPRTAVAPALDDPAPGAPGPGPQLPPPPAGAAVSGPDLPPPPAGSAVGGPNLPPPPVGSAVSGPHVPPPPAGPAVSGPPVPPAPAGPGAGGAHVPLPTAGGPGAPLPSAGGPGTPLPPVGGVPGGPGTPPPAGAAPSGPGMPPPPVGATPGGPGMPPPAGAPGAGPQLPPPPAGAAVGGPGTPPPPEGVGAPQPGAPGGAYVATQLVSSLGPEGPQPPGAPQPPAAPGGPGTPPGGVHHAATMLADPSMGGGPQPPAAPGAPGAPGAPQPPGPPGVPGTPPGGVHHAATMLADPSLGGAPKPPGAPGVPGAPQPPGPPGAPGAPQPPGAPGVPGAPGGGVHHAATMLAGPAVGGPGAPLPPAAPGAPGMPPPAPGAVPPGPGMVPPGAGQPYGYPQPPTGQPTVGPGYQAVLRYRAPDGSEQQVIRRSAPGTPHPEWQIFHELRGMNIPADQVLELHTELESCELPGAYCARMIRETWPQARITSIAPYGRDHASRQQGMQQLLAHQGELHQVADGPARPAPVRAPLPPVAPAPPVPPEAVAQELAGAFGPGVFRFDQRAVSRQGVPDVVAHTLVVAGLPLDFGPFFWAQAQPGRPVPTLAELAQERGVAPASDAGSYLVMGSDFGRALCVQYGTAHIVAVPVEAGPGGAPVPPQFVNTGLPEFVRCLALLGRMWRLRYGLNQEQAGRWTVDFQSQLAALDPAALSSPETWWSVLLEQMWDGLL
ncbi:SUKH-4 family immunity protein [Streptomyces sp. AN091965]|uniref:SUKH-4 family immunity protein n=1 Tax=Streptomyces sp. AN091965 TaxID=2927803 RepID=UPI001F60030A|nr:SUKH-4 family immunity protein [Streptomyces sp. AN091965]MCI3931189.1 SUKH-4 family immunity protein [Streptomyces sp. AN091965]